MSDRDGPGDGPRYERIATDVLRRMAARGGPARGRVPAPTTIAREYGVSVTTARFVCRAARTRLRVGNAPLRSAAPAVRPAPAARGDLRSEEIASDLWRRVESGELRGMFPSQLSLAAHYRVPRSRVRKALRGLIDEGRAVDHGTGGVRILRPLPPLSPPPPSASPASSAD
ncbi:hypothetical protein ACN20G_29380 (plasmid) [Streptomyces sp. BI20]|uniref:hypothetical protein n=1 Tax=Streptomyces sp. BI20 TaxID=3403460 RepID=UPI003C720DED